MSWWNPADVGFATRRKLVDIGHSARLLVRLLSLLGPTFARGRLLRDQVHFLGNYSLAIIAVSCLFVGFVLALQGYYILQRYGSSEALGLMVALSLVRELGPVVTALLFAGRAGTSLTAEIGLMKAGEQLSAMEMMAVDPVQRILAPRFWGGVIAMPLLAAVFSAVGIIGGYVVGVLLIGVDSGAFWSQMQGGVDVWKDVGNGVIKSVVFGFVVTWIAVFQGYDCEPTSEGISRATTKTVVYASLAVLSVSGGIGEMAADYAQMEGLPLALELAAAWVRHLGVEEIAAEVERDLDFLAGTTVRAPEWMQRAGLEWLHRAASDHDHAVQSDLLEGHHLAALLLPVRLEVVLLDQVAGQRLDPVRLDLGHHARVQLGGFHQLGGHQPLRTFLAQT